MKIVDIKRFKMTRQDRLSLARKASRIWVDHYDVDPNNHDECATRTYNLGLLDGYE